jgi:hypothetical protein
MFIITEDPIYSIRKNGAKVTEELRIVVWRLVYSNYGAAKIPRLVLLGLNIIPPN